MSSNDVEGDYFKNLNPASNTWDLIIIQDYRESCMSAKDNASNNNNQDYVFIDTCAIPSRISVSSTYGTSCVVYGLDGHL